MNGGLHHTGTWSKFVSTATRAHSTTRYPETFAAKIGCSFRNVMMIICYSGYCIVCQYQLAADFYAVVAPVDQQLFIFSFSSHVVRWRNLPITCASKPTFPPHRRFFRNIGSIDIGPFAMQYIPIHHGSALDSACTAVADIAPGTDKSALATVVPAIALSVPVTCK
jgi:hypothetical protein